MVLTHKSIYKKIGVNYLIYSSLAAKITRKALKQEFLKAAYPRDISLINIFHVKDGRKGETFIPLQPKVEEETALFKKAEPKKVSQEN